MSVIIITGGGGKAAIDKIVGASEQGKLNADERAIAEFLIAKIIDLADKIK